MTVVSRERKWWKEAVIYQIYPASFCDSNGDGVGDLAGITSKLDYIASLGANVVWICPMYDSPQVDMGYDIANYEDVYRPYGTVADMEHLIKEAHNRNLKVMLDLVINHTSDKHAWFQESKASKDSAKRDWYIWRPAKYSADGQRMPPNNWRSCFGGGSAWQWDEATQEYYLHLFAVEQPDLNWENPETRKAIYASAMEFWLERGCDGFRIDTVNMYSKPEGLIDAPIVDSKAPYQPAGLLYCNGPRMHEYLSEMNAILSKYGAITVGELPCTPDMSKVLKYVSAKAKQMDMVFQFDVVDVGFGTTHKFETTPHNFTLPDFKEAVTRTQTFINGTDGWTTAFVENHDQARCVSRFANDSPEFRERSAKLLALMQSSMTGTQYVYQGQEIGSINLPLEGYPVENYLDLDSYLYWDMVKERYGAANKAELDKAFAAMQYLARDHARVPMAWDGKGKYGGFSLEAEKAGKEVKEPWMKPHPLAGEINVAAQLDDPNSVLAFYRKMLAFRREHADLLVYGDFRDLRPSDRHLFLYAKEDAHSGDKMVVALNFSAEDKKLDAPTPEELGVSAEQASKLVPILSTYGGKTKAGVLAPFEGQAFLLKA